MENVDIGVFRRQIAAEYGVPTDVLTADSVTAMEKQAQVIQNYLDKKGARLSPKEQFTEWIKNIF